MTNKTHLLHKPAEYWVITSYSSILHIFSCISPLVLVPGTEDASEGNNEIIKGITASWAACQFPKFHPHLPDLHLSY